MNEREKIRKVVQQQVDAWVDSLGDLVTVEDASEVMKYALRFCDVMLKLKEKPSKEKKSDG